MRFLVGSIGDWEALFTQAFHTLRPGGWLESYESGSIISSDDGTVPEDSALGQWGKLFGNYGEETGRSFAVVSEGLQVKAMEAAGFVDVQVCDLKVRTRVPHRRPLPPYVRSCQTDLWFRHRWAPGPRTQNRKRLANTPKRSSRPISRAISCIRRAHSGGHKPRSPYTRLICAGSSVLRRPIHSTVRRLCGGGSLPALG